MSEKRPSQLYNVRGEGRAKTADLDNRYGKERKSYRFEGAQEMARVDDLIEKAGIKPGDSIEVLVEEEGEEKWVSDPNFVFEGVDNGRFRVQPVDPGGNHPCQFPSTLSKIRDVRKI